MLLRETRYVNDVSSGRSRHGARASSFAGKSKALARAHIPASPLRQQRRSGRRGEAASPSCPTRPTSPFVALPPLLSFFSLVSHSVIRLCRKCAVSSCTSPVLSSPHVNKHPECITGPVLCAHAAPCTADGHVTPAQPHRSDTDVPAPPTTAVHYDPHPAPTGGDVAPSMASNHPHAPRTLCWVLS